MKNLLPFFIEEFINNTLAKNAVKSDFTTISADYNTRKAI